MKVRILSCSYINMVAIVLVIITGKVVDPSCIMHIHDTQNSSISQIWWCMFTELSKILLSCCVVAMVKTGIYISQGIPIILYCVSYVVETGSLSHLKMKSAPAAATV